MAHQALTTAKWLLSKKSELGVRFLEFNWALDYNLPLFDFEVSILGGQYIGRGASADQEVALEKACAEALERFICFENGISTDGVAAHPFAEMATRNATREAIERHLFHDHLRSEAPFCPAGVLPDTGVIKDALENRGATVSWTKMRAIPNHESSVCLIRKNDRFFLGLGLGESLASVQLHSTIEALRNFAAYIENPEQFVEQAESNPNLWFCSGRFFEKHKNVFSGIPETAELAVFEQLPIEVRQLDCTLHPAVPLYFAQAKVTRGIA